MINLLTDKQKKTIHHIRILRIWIAIIVGTVSLISISFILFFPTFLAINAKYVTAKEDEKKIQMAEALTPEAVEALSKNVTAVAALFSPSEFPSTLNALAVLEEKNMQGISISRISNPARDKKTLEIGGIATTRSVLGRYEASLRNDPRIEKVESPVSNYVKTQNAVFVLKILFK